MPSPEAVIALDHLCWLGSGRNVADRLGCNPSTISRKAEACVASLGMVLRKRGGFWSLYGDGDLLQAERDLHQRYRFAGYGPLRLDLSADLATALAIPPHPAWCAGGQRHFTYRRPLELLEQRVIDGWLCSFCEELPSEEQSFWQVLELVQVPLLLLADGHHPLLGSDGGDPASLEALRQCPCLALPEHCQPRRQAVLRRLGLANQLLALERYDPLKWDAPLEDGRTIRPGLVFELHQNPSWCSLPLSLAHQVCVGLVVRRDLAEHQATLELHAALIDWFAQALN
ncbi:MAG: hypothetical protein VKJ05_09735 [Synechococcaceae cyanobacterium]|nr:hypothetical protein [Synechococcaceae cyanobacterium]